MGGTSPAPDMGAAAATAGAAAVEILAGAQMSSFGMSATAQSSPLENVSWCGGLSDTMRVTWK